LTLLLILPIKTHTETEQAHALPLISTINAAVKVESALPVQQLLLLFLRKKSGFKRIPLGLANQFGR
jgi:hypothetical protein